MTPTEALAELLARISANGGAAVFIGTQELEEWPNAIVAALKAQKILVAGRPAASVLCPGCEQECIMPVHVIPAQADSASAFVLCDKRDDINRVYVPVGSLQLWHASTATIADCLARLLGLRRFGSPEGAPGTLRVGVFGGATRTSDLVLLADGELRLTIAGHEIPLTRVLTLDDGALSVDKGALLQMIDGDFKQPSVGIGSRVWRRRQAKAAADARHNKPGGSKSKQALIREIWASGKYTSRDRCAEEECGALGMSYSTARKALRNAPEPKRP